MWNGVIVDTTDNRNVNNEIVNNETVNSINGFRVSNNNNSGSKMIRAVASTFIVTAKNMTGVMSGCKSSINGNFFSS